MKGGEKGVENNDLGGGFYVQCWLAQIGPQKYNKLKIEKNAVTLYLILTAVLPCRIKYS